MENPVGDVTFSVDIYPKYFPSSDEYQEYTSVSDTLSVNTDYDGVTEFSNSDVNIYQFNPKITGMNRYPMRVFFTIPTGFTLESMTFNPNSA